MSSISLKTCVKDIDLSANKNYFSIDSPTFIQIFFNINLFICRAVGIKDTL